jgi:uncharacterized membrane protein YdbT with pleckstrin-like domain
MKPNYVAKKSAWSCVSFWWIVGCIFIIPLIVLIFRIMAAKQYAIEFYDDKVIVKSGLLNTNEHEMVFMGVLTVSIHRSLWGNLFNYGDIRVDCVGQWDLNHMSYIKDPEGLKKYLQTKIVTSRQNPNSANMSTNMFVHM